MIIDEKLKPWLLEINYTPSFTTDTPLDRTIKKGVIKEAIEIMNMNPRQKTLYEKKERERITQLTIMGRKKRLT